MARLGRRTGTFPDMLMRLNAGTAGNRPIVVTGDGMYPVLLAEAVNNGHITHAEAEERYETHKLILRAQSEE